MIYPEFNKIAFSFWKLDVHWYGISYLMAIAIAFYLLKVRARRPEYQDWNKDRIADLVFYGVLGVVIGGRLGYVFIYGIEAWSNDLLYPFKIWKGGMSFHGGLLGVILAMWGYGRHLHKGFFSVADYVAPVVPLGLGSGRIGNFINSELWGKPTDLPWGMRIRYQCGDPNQPNDFYQKFQVLCDTRGEQIYTPPLHPSQLYEFLLEGLALFGILWLFARKQRPLMAISGVFLLGYGVFRFLVEFVRLPDAHIGYDAFGWLTRGQIVTIPMIVIGLIFIIIAYKRNQFDRSATA